MTLAMRIQKFLSESGTASRREAEKLILAGRVSVNGKVVKELWTQIDPDKDIVSLDNKPIKKQEERVTLILFKPRGYVTTLKDEKGGIVSVHVDPSFSVRRLPVAAKDQAKVRTPVEVLVDVCAFRQAVGRSEGLDTVHDRVRPVVLAGVHHEDRAPLLKVVRARPVGNEGAVVPE